MLDLIDKIGTPSAVMSLILVSSPAVALRKSHLSGGTICKRQMAMTCRPSWTPLRRPGPQIERICAEVWQEAELSKEEVKSAQIHIRELEAAGFAITSRGTSGYPTAFVGGVASRRGWRQAGLSPRYDALPHLGNAPVSEQAPRSNSGLPVTAAATTFWAPVAPALRSRSSRLMEQDSVAGTLRVYGCATEESAGVKVYMARDGLFDDLDACLAWHSAPMAMVGPVRAAAVNQIQVEFFGKTARVGFAPWEGRSALHTSSCSPMA